MEERGLGKGWGPEWSPGSSLRQSGPAPPPTTTISPPCPSLPGEGAEAGPAQMPVNGVGGGAAGWLMRARGGRGDRDRVRCAERWARRPPRPRCRSARTPRLPVLSALVSVPRAPPHSSSVQCSCSPLPHPPGPRCSIHTHRRAPPSPGSSCSRRSWAPPRLPRSPPDRTDWKGGARTTRRRRAAAPLHAEVGRGPGPAPIA